MSTLKAFSTFLYRESLKSRGLNAQLITEVDDICSLDQAGARWSKKNYKNGFTSYASANQLQKFSPTFAKLEKLIDRHVKKFVTELEFELGGRPLRMTNCWVNVMNPHSHHGLHLHPLSVISGTYYVKTPPGASALKFEDPRLGLFMGSPPKKENARKENRNFFSIPAKAGNLVLFESWLRHEVPLQIGKEERISVSFNYGWGD